MKIIQSILFFVLLFTAVYSAQAQTETCTVLYSYLELDSGNSTSQFRVGTFTLDLKDDDTTHFFHHEESAVDISVGVRKRIGISKGDINKISLRISFTGNPDDDFDDIVGAEAQSIYDKHWKSLAVSNEIKVENRIYTYRFGCSRVNKKLARQLQRAENFH